MKILGIYREKMFSPGKVDDDARILGTTLTRLARRGHTVQAMSPDDLSPLSNGADCVVSMAESDKALAVMQEWEAHNVRVVNRPQAIYGCRRDALTRRLMAAGLPLPDSRMVPVRDMHLHIPGDRAGECWVKRSDVHSTQPGDVVKIGCPSDLQQAAGHFARNRIEHVIVQSHAEGESIKFYGVADGTFFAAFVSDESGKKEEVTYPCLQALAEQAARVVGLEVFGGDAILTPDGQFLLVDVNDWPSFSCCLDAAAEAIARYVDKALNEA